MKKKGALTDMFIFIIFVLIIAVISVVWVYISTLTYDQMQDTIGQMNLSDASGNNASTVIDNTMGVTKSTIGALKWISIFLIFGMIIAIFISSYLVTTKPVFFIPYIFLMIIAVVVSVPISNSYETMMEDPTLSSTFAGFTGLNWLVLNLPIIVVIVGITGGIIMFIRLGKGGEQTFAYG